MTLKSQVILARSIVAIDPSVADYHHLLGILYGFQNDFANALRSIEAALAIEANPDWLYSKASAMRQQDGYNAAEVISTYKVEKFIDIFNS